jgi:hypothetical protein
MTQQFSENFARKIVPVLTLAPRPTALPAFTFASLNT